MNKDLKNVNLPYFINCYPQNKSKTKTKTKTKKKNWRKIILEFILGSCVVALPLMPFMLL